MPRLAKENGYGLDHAYKFFKKKHGKLVERELYRKICYDLNKMIVDNVVEGRVVHLPHAMGSLWAKKFEVNYEKPPVDLNETKKAGKTIYHLNHHSDGFMAKFTWSKRNNLIANLIYYSFKPTKANSSKISQVMKQPDGHKRYFT